MTEAQLDRVKPEETASFKAEFFDNLYDLEAGNFWFRGRNALIIWALKKFFADADSFLEIGCGTGFVLSGIRKANEGLKLFGSELFAEGLRYARQRLTDVELIELDARQLDAADAYDVIGAFDVIEHIQEDELVLQQLFKACRKGIMITVPQHMFLWSAVDDYSCHKRRYSREELVSKVTAAGFKVTYVGSFVSLLLPLLMVSRLRKKKLEDIEPMAELSLSKPLNAILEAALTVERTLITCGLNFLAGGSLLLVARKLQN